MVAGLTFSTNIACLIFPVVNDAVKIINLEGGARDLSSKIAACTVFVTQGFLLVGSPRPVRVTMIFGPPHHGRRHQSNSSNTLNT